VIENEFRFCPFCGVQCRDLLESPAGGEGLSRESVAAGPPRNAIQRLTEIESTLEDMEHELDHFLSSRNQ